MEGGSSGVNRSCNKNVKNFIEKKKYFCDEMFLYGKFKRYLIESFVLFSFAY